MPKGREITICKVDGCDVRVVSHGLCRKHWMRFQRHGTTDEPKDKWGHRVAHFCSVDGCDRQISSNGMCRTHAGRLKNRGTTEPLVRERKPYVNTNGYVYEYVDGERQAQLQHRLVMERVLGRRLWADETVHHKNGIRTDNRPENLELWVSWQPHGCRVEDLVTFAREVLARYSTEV